MSSDSPSPLSKKGGVTFSTITWASPKEIKTDTHGKLGGHEIKQEKPNTNDSSTDNLIHETQTEASDPHKGINASREISPKTRPLERRMSSSKIVKLNKTNDEAIAPDNTPVTVGKEDKNEKKLPSIGLSKLSLSQKIAVEEALHAPRKMEEIERSGKSTKTITNSPVPERKTSGIQNVFSGFRQKNVTNSDSSLTADEGKKIIYQGAAGKIISPKEYLNIAEKLRNSPNRTPEDSTVMHLLYEKAAVGFLKEGKVKDACNARAASAKAVEFSESHPLHNMSNGIQEGVAQQAIPDVGLHMESGSSRMAEAISFCTRPADSKGNDKSVLFCQLTPAARKEFAEKFEQVFGTIDPSTKQFSDSNIKEFEKSLPDHLKPVKITYKGGIGKDGGTEEAYNYQGKDSNGNFTSDSSKGVSINTPSFEIEFGKGAKFVIGASPTFKTIYETIRLEVPSGQKDGTELKQMQQILAVMGLGPVMGAPLQADDERSKMGLMLRLHFPQAWDKIQEDANYYDYSVGQLKQKMIEIEPRMQAKFDMYEQNPHLVEKRQIFPGKEVYALGDISQEMEKAGVNGFFTGTAVKGAAAFLKSGITSSDLKKRAMISSVLGVSEIEDMMLGGSMSMFLRTFNDNLSQIPISSGKFPWSNDYQVIYKTKVIDVGGICYHGDQFGVRNIHYTKNGKTFQTYAHRQSPVEFAQTLSNSIDKFPVNQGVSLMGTWDFEIYEGEAVVNDQGKVILGKGDVLYNGTDEDMPDNVETHVVGEKTYHVIKDPSIGASNEATIDGGNISPEFVSVILTQTEDKKQILLRELEANGNLLDVEKDANGIITQGTVAYNNGPGQEEIKTSIHDLIIVTDFLPGRPNVNNNNNNNNII